MSESRTKETIVARFARFAAEPDDAEAIRLRKIIGTAIIVSAISTYLIYGMVYIAFDEKPAGYIALGGGCLFILALISYGMFRHYAEHWRFCMATVALTLTAIHFALGGFASAGMVLIWVLTVPLLTIVADSPRNGLRWSLAIAILVGAAALVDSRLQRGNNLPEAMVTTLSAVNILGFATYMLLAVFYYVWQVDVIGKVVVKEREARVQALEHASRQKSEFLANMSHELRTPLNAILGFSEVLRERYFGDLNDKQGEYVGDIHSSGQHLLVLINDILDLSKIEAGKMELQIAEFDLPSALQNAITLIRERAQRHGIAIVITVDPILTSLRADERKFKQIMLNILSNAVKFTPDGGSVTVTAVSSGSDVDISVKDTGAGIAPADHAAVFEEFMQVGRDSARKAEGTGLGMPLTKRLVELHGGTIHVESELGRGATFRVMLPRQLVAKGALVASM